MHTMQSARQMLHILQPDLSQCKGFEAQIHNPERKQLQKHIVQ